jgi:murein DD-endopeptidase MepM/ murein hydrolase activator NlpD
MFNVKGIFFMRKRLTAIALSLVMLLSMSHVVNLSATPATRERLAELEQQDRAARTNLRETAHLLDATREEMSELFELMLEYDQKMMDAADRLMTTERNLLATEVRIYDAEIELERVRVERDLHYELLRERLRVMHEYGQAGLLEVFIQSNNFAEFLSHWEHVRAIARFDQELLDDIEALEAEYVEIVEDLVRARNLVADLYFQQARAFRELEDIQEAHRVWMYSLADDEAFQEELYQLLLAEQAAIYLELQGMRVVYQREVEAAERERQRQAAIAAEQRRQEILARRGDFDGIFEWPSRTHTHISSPFGRRRNPITRRYENHTGIDIPKPTGTRIYAAAGGVVRFSGWMRGFGNTVIIDHCNGYSTLYAHNSLNIVQAGDEVATGQHIANAGSTGMSTGPHLHFEIRYNNVPRNPVNYFPWL